MKSSPIDLARQSLNPTTWNIALVILIVVGAVVFAGTARFVLSRLSERFPARRLVFKRLQPVFQIGAYGVAAYFTLTILSPNQTSREAFATELLIRVRHALFEEAQRLAKKKAAEGVTLQQVEELARHVVAEQIMALGSRFAHPGPVGIR